MKYGPGQTRVPFNEEKKSFLSKRPNKRMATHLQQRREGVKVRLEHFLTLVTEREDASIFHGQINNGDNP